MHKKTAVGIAQDVGRLKPPAGVSRRTFFKYAGAALALMVSPVGFAAAPSMVAVRVWPAPDYTRITLESSAEVKFSHMMLDKPERLVVDLEGIELNEVVKSLSEKVLESDPYIKLIRAAVNRPGVVRIVVELKDKVDPQLFTLKPIADYGHRLVLDLYPKGVDDPLLAFIQKSSPMEAAAGDKGKNSVARATPPGKTPNGGSANVAANAPDANRLITIVLDPGHGGEDPGAIGRRGSKEKNVTLSIARRLKRKIDAEPNMRAVMTRSGDHFVPLRQRVEIARKLKADLFVSIHADAFVKPEARGSSVYVLSERGATSEAASWLARKENDADLIGGVNLAKQDGHLARTLFDLSQTATINDSLKLGKAVLSELGGINKLHKPKVEQAAFAVLKAPDIPSILVETAFISNPEEERRLNDNAYQDKMANAIIRGVRQYFKANPPVSRTTVARL